MILKRKYLRQRAEFLCYRTLESVLKHNVHVTFKTLHVFLFLFTTNVWKERLLFIH